MMRAKQGFGPVQQPKQYVGSDMTPEAFLVWLQGVIDILGDQPPTETQWLKLRETAETVIGRLVAQKMINNDMYHAIHTQQQEFENQLAIEKLKLFNDMIQHQRPRRLDAIGIGYAPPGVNTAGKIDSSF
jgi:hypothetical protein